jgi:hypothetical protein
LGVGGGGGDLGLDFTVMIRTSNPHFPCSEDSASHSDEQLELLFFYFSVVEKINS